MKLIKKTIRSVILFIIIILTAAVFVNNKTKFFKNIGAYIPSLYESSPETVEEISTLSDRVNEFVSQIPTPSEFIARLRHTELPIDPDDAAANVYYSSDTMLSFYNRQNISVAINGSELDVYGVTDNANHRHLVYRFLDSGENVLEQFTDSCDSEGKYRKIMRIPNGTYQFAVFTGPEEFGEYESMLFNYILLEQNADGGWRITPSPVHDSNIAEYEKDKSLSRSLKTTYDICSNDINVRSLAQSITSSCADDYGKAAALHDWVCENIYYDVDSVSTDGLNTADYVATDVLNKRKAVCLGYSNLYAALCRSISIPCNVVTGYALGVSGYDSAWNSENIYAKEPNHAWNEVYIDNRWVIVDTTWDSRNRITGGVQTAGRDISHLYFDANIEFFSRNHKIIEY